jgi:hypothetical protein
MIKSLCKFMLIVVFGISNLAHSIEGGGGGGSSWGVSKPSSELSKAFENGDIKQIEEQLKNYDKKIDPDMHDYLLKAKSAQKFNKDQVIAILDLMIEYDALNIDKLLLHASCNDKHLDILQIAHELGGDINYSEPDAGGTPLMFAALDNSLNIAKYLIRSGVNLNWSCDSGRTALHIAHVEWNLMNVKNNPEMIKLLLVNDADITIADNTDNNKTFLDQIEYCPKLQEFIKNFIVEVVNMDDLSDFKGAQNALLLAAYVHGNPLNFNTGTIIHFLLSKGAHFTSEKYELLFNNLIADKPDVLEAVKNYKHLLAQNVDKASDLIPDLANIVAQY